MYAYDHRSDRKRQQAVDLIGAAVDDWVVRLTEFFWTVTRKLEPPLDPASARTATSLISRLPVVTVDRSLVLTAIDTSDRHSISLWDALIVEAAVRSGCDQLLSEDLDAGQTIRGVRITDPFG